MSRPKNILAISAALLVLGCVFAIAQMANNSTSGKLSASDQKFMKEAAQGGQAEVELGQLAQQKAESPDVKAFGERMVNDHAKANDQLKQVASEKGVTLPDQADAQDNAEKARLEKMSGAQFDKAYMNYMVADHKKDVADFKKEAAHANDPDLKNFAQTTLPTLESHLQQAESTTPKQTAAAAKGSTTASASQR